MVLRCHRVIVSQQWHSVKVSTFQHCIVSICQLVCAVKHAVKTSSITQNCVPVFKLSLEQIGLYFLPCEYKGRIPSAICPAWPGAKEGKMRAAY